MIDLMAMSKEQEESARTRDSQRKTRRPTYYVNAAREAILGDPQKVSHGKRIGEIIDRYGALAAAHEEELRRIFTPGELATIARAIAVEDFANPAVLRDTIASLVRQEPDGGDQVAQKIRRLDYGRALALVELAIHEPEDQ